MMMNTVSSPIRTIDTIVELLGDEADSLLNHQCQTISIVRRVDRTGGTFLHTSRTNPASVKSKEIPDFLREAGKTYDEPQDLTPHILKVIEKLGIDCLIPIGGDDTLGYGARLAHEGVRVIGIPKTMDNDVYGTDYCIGFSTAVTRSVEFIHALRTV